MNEKGYVVEFEPIKWKPSSADKTKTFCNIMHVERSPEAFKVKVITQLVSWKLLSENDVDLNKASDYEEYRRLILKAQEKCLLSTDEFLTAFNDSPWNFDWSVEAEYSEEELDLFPGASELRNKLGEGIKFFFIAMPATQYAQLIEREDGRKQVMRRVETDREVSVINEDSKNSPEIIPSFEAIQFNNGKKVLLIDWINGEMPSSESERHLCITEGLALLEVPISIYDLWAGNFLITKERKVFYVDQDIPQAIAKHGLHSDTVADRAGDFLRSIKKMK